MFERIVNKINNTVKEYKNYDYNTGFICKKPIIRILSAQNKEINNLKKIISPDHLLPTDILNGAKSVISFFIPFTNELVKSNIQGKMASRKWALAYIKTNELINTISNQIESLMKSNGFSTGKIPATHNFDEKKLISNWSHRHIAYIAGIGTFGINNMLITEYGCCGRLGSIITNYQFSHYEDIKVKEKCLYKINESCGICQNKCIVNAYEGSTFNRKKCYEICLKNAKYYKSIGYADVCGKCLVGLPCSTKDPSINS
jgi:epoxyqueuosine reductase QueG